jgi:chemotaxis protein histidine kinase CheA
MSRQQPIEIFTPPNLLKAKVGGSGGGGIDMAAVARAEKAFGSLQSEFTDWIAEDVKRLAECREVFAKAPGKDTRDAFYRAAHDMRGQALTFGYPLAARIAVSLCKLLEAENPRAMIPLAEAHVDAIRIIVRDKLKENANQVAEHLAKELEARVTESLLGK